MTPSLHGRWIRWMRRAGAAAPLLLLGCASKPFAVPEPMAVHKSSQAAGPARDALALAAQDVGTGLYQTPAPPPPERSKAGATAPPAPPAQTIGDTALVFEQMPLPTFVQTVFGTILKRNVAMDTAVAQRTDLITLRTGTPQTAEQLFVLARALLKSYGVAVSEFGSLVRVTVDTAQTGYLPELRRGRALPDTPVQLRPVFHLVELQAVTPQSVSQWLRAMFGNKITAQDDLPRGAVLLSGQSDDVRAAIEAIQVLDQPLMRGRVSARVAPRFWAAEELARRLADVMVAQGYSVSNAPNAQVPIVILPIGPLNSLIVFAGSEQTLNHTLRWAQELDQPGQARGTAGYFTYPVRNTDAASLAKTLQEIISGQAAAAPPPSGTPGQPAAAAPAPRARVVVNPATNTLIIQGNAVEYQQWLGLLQELDRPARSAMISVTVAEVRLTEGEQFGFEFLVRSALGRGYNIVYGTLGGLGVPSEGAGFSAVVRAPDGDPRAILNLLASTNRVRVLSNPSILARNGESATIQVGQEVPIVTSQQSNADTGAGAGGILQTIQYRQVGVILRVRPVIHAGGRVELDVQQEVSQASETRTGVTASPTISNRRVETRLSVSDGSTIVLGGLIERRATQSDSGIPYLKDIPGLGALFSNRSDNVDAVELVVLITPYVIENDFEAAAVTDAFRRQFPWAVPVPSTAPARPAPESAPPGAGEKAAPVAPSPSKPYLLPPADTPKATPDVSPAQQPKEQSSLRHGTDSAPAPMPTAPSPAPATAPPTPAPGGADARSPSESGVVKDEALLKELRDAVKPPPKAGR